MIPCRVSADERRHQDGIARNDRIYREHGPDAMEAYRCTLADREPVIVSELKTDHCPQEYDALTRSILRGESTDMQLRALEQLRVALTHKTAAMAEGDTRYHGAVLARSAA